MAHFKKRLERLRQHSFLSFGPSKYLAAGRLGGGVISAGWLVLIARSLTKDDFAVVVLVLSMSSLTSVLHDGGQCLLLTRQAAEFPSKRIHLFELVLIRRMRLAVLGILLGGATFIFIADVPLSAVALIAPSILATVVYTTVFATLRAEGRVGLESAHEFVSRIGVFISGVVVSIDHLTAVKVIIIYTVVDLFSMVVVVSKHIDFFRFRDRVQLSRRDIGQLHWRGSFVVGLTGGVGVIVAKVDPILISGLAGNVELAKFALGSRLVEFFIVPIGAIVAIRIADFARVGSDAQMVGVMRAILTYSLVAIVVLELFATFLSRVFGADYAGAIAPLRISAVSLMPVGCSMALLGWLTVRRPSFAFISVLIGLISSVILHLSVTARHGAVGGAFVNLATNVSIAITTMGLFWYKLSSERRVLKQFEV